MRIAFTNRPYNIFSWLIRLYTWSKYSHCIVIHDKKVIEASFGKVKVTPLTKWYGNIVEQTDLFDFNRDETFAMLEYLYRQVDKPYGVLTILGIVLYDVFKITVFNDKTKSFTCSEYIYRAMTYANILKDNFKNADYISPEELHEYIWNGKNYE